jgi:hypothetical protein
MLVTHMFVPSNAIPSGYEGDATFDIQPASATRFYFAGGALIGSTLRE